MVRDLVAGLEDPLDDTRMPVGGQPRDEERRGRGVLGQQLQQTRHPDLRPVGLMAHQHRVVRVPRVLGEHDALRVHVERQHGQRRTPAPPRSHQRVCGKPRSTLEVAGSGQRAVTTLPRV